MPTTYIGADVDCRMTEIAAEENRQIIYRSRVPTTITALRSELAKFTGKKIFVIEECAMASWLYRNLQPFATEVVVCDPRRNALVFKDGDKADDLDAAALAKLCRGGFLRKVHHPLDEDRQALREAVALYYDRVEQRVSSLNKFYAACYMHGISARRNQIENVEWREEFLGACPRFLRRQLEILSLEIDSVFEQSRLAKQLLVDRAKKFSMIENFCELPGVKWVRASTVFAYIDTPFRFKTIKKIWKYCGIGLQRFASGSDKIGNPKSGRVKLFKHVNYRLKTSIFGAALSAIICGGNEFSEHYKRMIRNGVSACNARHTVARKMLTVMVGMCKTDSQYVPGLRN